MILPLILWGMKKIEPNYMSCVDIMKYLFHDIIERVIFSNDESRDL